MILNILWLGSNKWLDPKCCRTENSGAVGQSLLHTTLRGCRESLGRGRRVLRGEAEALEVLRL